jgi:hypothetical protein
MSPLKALSRMAALQLLLGELTAEEVVHFDGIGLSHVSAIQLQERGLEASIQI